MLLYPASTGQSGLIGAVSAAISSALSGQTPGATSTVPQSVMPVALFIWGAGRIVPVRVTGLTITEKLYDSRSTRLMPRPSSRCACSPPPSSTAPARTTTCSANLATTAYNYTFSLRQTLALANLANAAESIIGMIPH